jgi:hypothetical protein
MYEVVGFYKKTNTTAIREISFDVRLQNACSEERLEYR